MKRIFIASVLMMALLIPLGASRAGARRLEKSQAEQSRAEKEQADEERTAVATEANYPAATLRRDFKNSFPIPKGEKLEYEIRLRRFPIYASIGVVTLENLGEIAVGQAPADRTEQENKPEPLIEGLNVEFRPAPGEKILHLRGTAVSKGMLVTLFGLDVNDRFETLVDLRDFSARVNLQEVKEGKKHSIQSSLFDPVAQQVTYLTTDLTKPDAPPRAKPLPRKDGMLSLLSAIYFVRLQKLKEGQMLSFPVSTGEENYQFDVLVGKREKLKTDCGNVKTIRLEPKLFGPGRLFKRKGQMTMWVSDDSKRTPLRLVAKTSAYTVTAKLLNFKQKCSVIEQDDEKRETDGNNETRGKDQ